MFDLLRQLLAEQTSPIEVIISLLVGVVVCMTIALVTYVAVMLCLWTVYLRKRGFGLLRVFLPSAEQFKTYFGEYVLAISTAILLSLTIFAKHTLVQNIMEYRFVDNTGVAASSGDATMFLLATLVRAPLAAGNSEEVRIFIEESVVPHLERAGLAGWLTERRLVIACLVLSAFYVLWLVRVRSKEPSKDPKYGRTIRGVFVLGVCATLLLLSPSLLADDSLAESAVAAFRETAETPTEKRYVLDDMQRAADFDQSCTSLSVCFALADLQAQVQEIDESTKEIATLAQSRDMSGLKEEILDLRTDHATDVSELKLAIERAAAARPSDAALAVDERDELRRRVGELERRSALLEAAQRANADALFRVGELETRLAPLEAAQRANADALVGHATRFDRLTGLINTLDDRVGRLERPISEPPGTGQLIVHAEPEVSHRVSGHQATRGPATYDLDPGRQIVTASGRAIPVIIRASKVTPIWLAAPRRPEPPEPTRPPQIGPTLTVPLRLIDISGVWNSSVPGNVYTITQNGNKFGWTLAGKRERGQGTIDGLKLTASWTGLFAGRGTADVTLGRNGRPVRIVWSNNIVFTRPPGTWIPER